MEKGGREKWREWFFWVFSWREERSENWWGSNVFFSGLLKCFLPKSRRKLERRIADEKTHVLIAHRFVIFFFGLIYLFIYLFFFGFILWFLSFYVPLIWIWIFFAHLFWIPWFVFLKKKKKIEVSMHNFLIKKCVTSCFL